ncbi:hypothetical protein [Sphingomonas sp.]|uniref:hypothetical protein n=1 Tax=Sphingomonas sp. TaxID=28214 RepID=UPI0035C86564
MKRSNHQLQGVLFVVVCVLVALVAYMAIHGSARRSNSGSTQAIASNNSAIADVPEVADLPVNGTSASQAEADEAEANAAAIEALRDDKDFRFNQSELANPVETGEGDATDCQGLVSADITAIGEPTATLAEGSVLENIEHLLHNTNTGELAFCSRDGHCYPAQITQRGQQVVVIKLPFCHVQSTPSQTVDGVEVYPVKARR